MLNRCSDARPLPLAHLSSKCSSGRAIFYPILNGPSKGDVVVLTKRMFDDDQMVLGRWMAALGRILL
jgi:hypothetical protein